MTRLTTQWHYHSVTASLFILTMIFYVFRVVHADESSLILASASQFDKNFTDSLSINKQTNELITAQDSQVKNELNCLALNIYFEARSESEQGQRAVGHVVMNRVANKYYPNTVCKVVQQGGEERLNRCQFSWWCDGRSDKPLNKRAWKTSMHLANAVYYGDSKDPTNGSLWYHADYVNPYWRKSLTLAKKIGQHFFYQKKKQPKLVLN